MTTPKDIEQLVPDVLNCKITLDEALQILRRAGVKVDGNLDRTIAADYEYDQIMDARAGKMEPELVLQYCDEMGASIRTRLWIAHALRKKRRNIAIPAEVQEAADKLILQVVRGEMLASDAVDVLRVKHGLTVSLTSEADTTAKSIAADIIYRAAVSGRIGPENVMEMLRDEGLTIGFRLQMAARLWLAQARNEPEPPVMSAEAIRVLDDTDGMSDEQVLVTVRKAAEDGRITTDEAVALLKYLSIPHHARRSRAELRQNATAKADAVGEPVRQAVERHTGKDTGGLEQLEVFGKLDKELSSIYAATEGKLLNEEEFLALTDIYGMVLRLKTLINTGEWT